MTGLTKTMTGVVAALALAAGIGAAQQAAPSKIDVDQLAKRLSLGPDVKKQISPDVNRLNELFSQRAEGQWGPGMRDELWEARGRVESALTPEQRLEFRAVLHDTYGIGPAADGYGMNRGYMMGPGGMGFGGGCGGSGSYGAMHRGPMQGGGMHPGPMHYGPMHGSPQGWRGR